MQLQVEEYRISYCDAAGRVLAEVAFPAAEPGVVNINHTFVDASLRGQGIAGALMEALAAELRRSGRKARPSCTYAVHWFDKHPEYSGLLE